MKITTTLKAFVTKYQESHISEMLEGNPDSIKHMSFFDSRVADWTEIGTAEITVEIHDKDTVLSHKIDSLKEQLKKDQADSEVRQSIIKEQIQNLLALTHQPEEV